MPVRISPIYRNPTRAGTNRGISGLTKSANGSRSDLGCTVICLEHWNSSCPPVFLGSSCWIRRKDRCLERKVCATSREHIWPAVTSADLATRSAQRFQGADSSLCGLGLEALDISGHPRVKSISTLEFLGWQGSFDRLWFKSSPKLVQWWHGWNERITLPQRDVLPLWSG